MRFATNIDSEMIFIDFGSKNRAKLEEKSVMFRFCSFPKGLQDAAHNLDVFVAFSSYDFYAFLS